MPFLLAALGIVPRTAATPSESLRRRPS